jgi:hypothetical protein
MNPPLPPSTTARWSAPPNDSELLRQAFLKILASSGGGASPIPAPTQSPAPMASQSSAAVETCASAGAGPKVAENTAQAEPPPATRKAAAPLSSTVPNVSSAKGRQERKIQRPTDALSKSFSVTDAKATVDETIADLETNFDHYRSRERFKARSLNHPLRHRKAPAQSLVVETGIASPLTSRSFDDLHRFLGTGLSPDNKMGEEVNATREPSDNRVELDTMALFSADTYSMLVQDSILAAGGIMPPSFPAPDDSLKDYQLLRSPSPTFQSVKDQDVQMDRRVRFSSFDVEGILDLVSSQQSTTTTSPATEPVAKALSHGDSTDTGGEPAPRQPNPVHAIEEPDPSPASVPTSLWSLYPVPPAGEPSHEPKAKAHSWTQRPAFITTSSSHHHYHRHNHSANRIALSADTGGNSGSMRRKRIAIGSTNIEKHHRDVGKHNESKNHDVSHSNNSIKQEQTGNETDDSFNIVSGGEPSSTNGTETESSSSNRGGGSSSTSESNGSEDNASNDSDEATSDSNSDEGAKNRKKQRRGSIKNEELSMNMTTGGEGEAVDVETN